MVVIYFWQTQNNEIGIIRIYHECEGGIETSILSIAIWNHVACRLKTNGDFFYPILTQIIDCFSCSPLNFAFLFKKKTSEVPDYVDMVQNMSRGMRSSTMWYV